MKFHGVILLLCAWLISAAMLEVEAQQTGSGSGDGDMLIPEESTVAGVVTPTSIADVTRISSAATAKMSPTTTASTTINIISSSGIQMSSQSVIMSQFPTTSTRTSKTTLPVASSVSLRVDSSSILTEIKITTTQPTPTPTTLSMSIVLLPATSEPTATMATTSVPGTTATNTTGQAISTNEQATTSEGSTTESASDVTTAVSTMSGLAGTAEKKLTTVEILIIVLVLVAVLIALFVIAICIFVILICKRSKKDDPVKREILSNWELQEPPKHGGVHLMKIRTLDSMEEIDGSPEGAGIEGSNGDLRSEPRGITNLREGSEGGSNTAFTFGVPMGIDKSAGKAAATVPDSKKGGGSEVLSDIAMQTGIKESASGLEKDKVSGGTLVTEALTATKKTTFTTTTFETVPSTSETEPKKAGASSDAVLIGQKEMDKNFESGGQKPELEQSLLANKDIERALGGVFRDIEVSTQL